MTAPDPVDVAAQAAALFRSLGVLCCVGGSLASSHYGEPRASLDVDLVAALSPEHAEPLLAAAEGTWIVSADGLRRGIASRSSFQLIHESALVKVDVFVPPDRPPQDAQIPRRRTVLVRERPPVEMDLLSPEDVVVQKLRWYSMGGGVSDRQWRDLVGVLKTQGAGLDHDYLRDASRSGGLGALLDRALGDAGLALRP